MTLNIKIPDEAEEKLAELAERQDTTRWSLKQRLALQAVDLIEEQHAQMQQAQRQMGTRQQTDTDTTDKS